MKKSIFRSWKFWVILWILFGVIGVSSEYSGSPIKTQRVETKKIQEPVLDNRSPAEKYFTSNMGVAKMTCQDAVKKQLKTPSKADFSNVEAGYFGSGEIEAGVMGNVDSQNSFGAMIRNTFVCKFKWNGNDFLIEDIKIGK